MCFLCNSRNDIEYKIIRSRRKTVEIRITSKGETEVRVPFHFSKDRVKEIVKEKESWILSRMKPAKERYSERLNFSLNYGSIIILLGKEYTILEGVSRSWKFDGENILLPPKLTSEEIKREVIKIYKCTAKNVIGEKVKEYSEKIGVFPTSVKITSSKTTWGSCSAKNGICFSWRLIMASMDIVSYVVVHELSHIIHHNHSAAFWQAVSSVLPDYKRRQAGLRKLQEKLSYEDWD